MQHGVEDGMYEEDMFKRRLRYISKHFGHPLPRLHYIILQYLDGPSPFIPLALDDISAEGPSNSRVNRAQSALIPSFARNTIVTKTRVQGNPGRRSRL